MSTPDFSVAYRAPGIVDVLMPKQEDVASYRLKASPDLDGTPTAYTAIVTARIGAGFLDKNVDRRKLHSMPGTGHVRATFNPDTFASGEPVDANLKDTQQFWMRFTPLDAAGVEGPDSDPMLVLTPTQRNGTERIVISGTAPVAPNVSGSFQICLARRMKHLVITNSGSNPLFVAFSPDGGEVQIPAGETSTNYESAQAVLFVRASGGTTDFSVSMTVAQDHV
jgi:hypothetical protein